MSKLNRRQLKKLLLREFKMMGMAPMGQMMHGSAYSQPDLEYDHPDHGHRSVDDIGALGGDEAFGVGFEAGKSGVFNDEGNVISHSKGSVSKEDCCKAVLCLIECCDCPETKQLLKECCEDILASC